MSLPVINGMHQIKEAVETALSDALSKSGIDETVVDKVMKTIAKEHMKQIMSVTKTSLETTAAAMKSKDIRKNKDAPHAPMNAYNLFGNELREQKLTWADFDTKHPHAKTAQPLLKKINAADHSYKPTLQDVAALWPIVNTVNRERFQNMAVADKERYEKELELYIPTPELPKAPHKSGVDLFVKEKMTTNKELSRKDVVSKWEELSAEEQSTYVDRVAKEKVLYRELNNLLKESLTEKERQKLEHEQNPNVPTKPKSAYLFFTIQQRVNTISEMEQKGEDITLPAVSQRMAVVWKNLTDQAKTPYQKMADDDKIRYQTEMELHSKGQYVSPKVVESKARAERQTAISLYVKHTKKVWKSSKMHEDKNGKEVHTLAVDSWKTLSAEQQQFWVKVGKGEESAPEVQENAIEAEKPLNDKRKKADEAPKDTSKDTTKEASSEKKAKKNK